MYLTSSPGKELRERVNSGAAQAHEIKPARDNDGDNDADQDSSRVWRGFVNVRLTTAIAQPAKIPLNLA